MRSYIKLEDVAERTTLSPSQVRRLVRSRQIPHTRVGRRILFDPDAVAEWLRDKGVSVDEALATYQRAAVRGLVGERL